ncbi:MAG: IPT/TIG domain-containing protein [Spirochaetales bacterium]|jgi:hypothetical protein|nr:IPT/TIG domain-containing protein [Spirochaetales bacterium]
MKRPARAVPGKKPPFPPRISPSRRQGQKKTPLREILLPCLTVFLLGTLLLVSSFFVEKTPVITEVRPAVASPGDEVVIQGRHFKDSREGGMVSLAGDRVISEAYLEWSDRRIVFRVPQEAASGMIRVSTSKGRSNGLLFTNRRDIPVILRGPLAPGTPYIEGVEPAQGAVGTLVTLRGVNFGFTQERGRVLWTQKPPAGAVSREEDLLIASSEADYDYEYWSDQEIRVYVPDGACSGNLRIEADRGQSNGKFFEVMEGPVVKSYTGGKGYQITYGIDIYNPRGSPEGVLDLWVPGLPPGQEQRRIERLRSHEPVWEDGRKMGRYHFEGIALRGDIRLEFTYWLERYALETQVVPGASFSPYNTGRTLYTVYTAPDPLIPREPALAARAVSLARRPANPYLKARALYDFVLQSLVIDPAPPALTPALVLERGRGGAYDYALLFCALARGAGIPARPVSGCLIGTDKRAVKHYWAEFYLEGQGWIPVDPALGDGLRFWAFPSQDSPEEYYFGGLDDRRITFSRGFQALRPVLSGTARAAGVGLPFLQSFYEESLRLDYYDSFWRDIQIIDWW